MTEATHAQERDLPDGGAILIPVIYRPRSTRAKDRWWVLRITARITMEEEEEQIRIGALHDILPLVVADVLKNPRLKTMREFYGTPGDKRFALVNSNAWTWPEKLAPAGYDRTPPNQVGPRLLGIAIDKISWQGDEYAKSAIAISLLNAGGSANGAVIGSGMIRYTAQRLEKGWTVELAEP